MDMDLTIQFNLSKLIVHSEKTRNYLDDIMEAGMFIVEDKYVEESPGDTGNLKQEIKTKKNSDLDYKVVSEATNNGHSYPLDLFTGTGKLKNAPDYGFTTGRVRANDVAYGIGGIRPNKASIRAKKKAERPYIQFVTKKLQTVANTIVKYK